MSLGSSQFKLNLIHTIFKLMTEPPSICGDDEFACADNATCVSLDYRCDYFNDCGDNSDETDDCVCESSEFECESGGCINGTWVCDGEEDCYDGSDEMVCGKF